MALKQQKIDVTDSVTGKIKNGEMELYLENTCIGKIKLSGNPQYDWIIILRRTSKKFTSTLP